MRLIAEILNLHSIFCGALTDQDGGRYGIALLARYPITIIDEMTLFRADDEQRVCIIARIDAPHPFMVITSHFSIADQDRLAQSDEVVNRLRDIDLPWILLGDFNARPESTEYHRIAQHGVDTFAVKGTGPGSHIQRQRSAPPNRLHFRLPENWEIRTAQVERHVDKSDHFPLTAELDLRPVEQYCEDPSLSTDCALESGRLDVPGICCTFEEKLCYHSAEEGDPLLARLVVTTPDGAQREHELRAINTRASSRANRANSDRGGQ